MPEGLAGRDTARSIAKLGAATTLVGAGTPCNPFLHVYNGGKGKLVFFFVIIPPKYTCATLKTGASAPYSGTVTQQGKNLVIDVPLPPDVSTSAGGLNGRLRLADHCRT